LDALAEGTGRDEYIHREAGKLRQVLPNSAKQSLGVVSLVCSAFPVFRRFTSNFMLIRMDVRLVDFIPHH